MIFNKSIRFVIAIMFVLFLITCTNNKNKTRYKIFRYNESKSIASLDPAFARNQASIWPINQLYNGLVQLNDSLNILPCIAKSWTISENGLVYTFYLRTDVAFHDHFLFKAGKGRKVIASDFVYSFNRLIDNQIASPGSWIFNMVDKQNQNAKNGFTALNDSVLVVYLKSPFPAFLDRPPAYCITIVSSRSRFVLRGKKSAERGLLARLPANLQRERSKPALPQARDTADSEVRRALHTGASHVSRRSHGTGGDVDELSDHRLCCRSATPDRNLIHAQLCVHHRPEHRPTVHTLKEGRLQAGIPVSAATVSMAA